jgi:hypothetical protein
VRLHERIGDFAVFAERAGSADLVEAHEPRGACDVGRDERGEPASDTSRTAVHPCPYVSLANHLLRRSTVTQGVIQGGPRDAVPLGIFQLRPVCKVPERSLD